MLLGAGGGSGIGLGPGGGVTVAEGALHRTLGEEGMRE